VHTRCRSTRPALKKIPRPQHKVRAVSINPKFNVGFPNRESDSKPADTGMSRSPGGAEDTRQTRRK